MNMEGKWYCSPISRAGAVWLGVWSLELGANSADELQKDSGPGNPGSASSSPGLPCSWSYKSELNVIIHNNLSSPRSQSDSVGSWFSVTPGWYWLDLQLVTGSVWLRGDTGWTGQLITGSVWLQGDTGWTGQLVTGSVWLQGDIGWTGSW